MSQQHHDARPRVHVHNHQLTALATASQNPDSTRHVYHAHASNIDHHHRGLHDQRATRKTAHTRASHGKFFSSHVTNGSSGGHGVILVTRTKVRPPCPHRSSRNTHPTRKSPHALLSPRKCDEWCTDTRPQPLCSPTHATPTLLIQTLRTRQGYKCTRGYREEQKCGLRSIKSAPGDETCQPWQTFHFQSWRTVSANR